MKVKDRTIVALVSIAAITFMVYLGHNSAMISLLAIIMGFYFGRETGDKEGD
ncbi:hypothetical protein ES707_18165 [subsurface metagenome]